MFHSLVAATAGLVPMAEGGAAGIDFSGAITTVLNVCSQVFNFITDNPILMILMGAALVPVGLGIFSAAKSAVS